MSGKDLTKHKSDSVATQEPAPSPVAPVGFEDFDMSELEIPRLRVLQGLSKVVARGGGKIGDFQDSITEEVIQGKVEFAVISITNGAAYFEAGEGLKCRSRDGITNLDGKLCEQCPFGHYYKTWGDDRKPPKCSATKDFLILRRDTLLSSMPYPMVVTFSKTSYPVGRKLASAMRLSGKDIFATGWVLTSSLVENDKGIFAAPSFSKGPDLSGSELASARQWYQIIKGVKIKVHDGEEDI